MSIPTGKRGRRGSLLQASLICTVVTSMWSIRSLKDLQLKRRDARGYCVQKAEKCFTVVHKSFQRFHIYYISFTEDILIFSAW